MRLLRVGEQGRERPAVLVADNAYADISDLIDDIDGAFLASNGPDSIRAEVARRAADGLIVPLAGQRVGAPIARPHQILCVGLNYLAHADESRMDAPTEPVIFSKSPNSIAGPYDPVVRPPGASKLDYEVELGVVIGSRCQYLASREEALAAIAGFVLVNDVSERDFQFRGEGQWLKGKSSSTFNPCGPYLVTADEVADGQPLDLWLEVNGQRRQTGTTADMIFDVPTILQHLSQFFVLEPGDLINTGTPPGVAFGMASPAYLEPGDVMTLGATLLGTQRSPVVTYA